MRERSYSTRRFTFVEMMIALVVAFILLGMLLPVIQKAKQQAKYSRWYANNKERSRDPACVLNYNFEHGSNTDLLKNSAEGYEHSKDNASAYDGTVHNADWSQHGRWVKGKHALQFNGLDTYVEIKGENSLSFTERDDFTILTSVKFNEFNAFDTIFGKIAWSAVAQYDLYFDGASSADGKTAPGRFTANCQKQTVGFDSADSAGANAVTLDRDHWVLLALRYEASGATNADGTPKPGVISCFVNGVKVKTLFSAYSASKTPTTKHRLILGAANWPYGAASDEVNPNDYNLRCFFNGLMDEFVVYKRALTDAEMKAHYDMGRE